MKELLTQIRETADEIRATIADIDQKAEEIQAGLTASKTLNDKIKEELASEGFEGMSEKLETQLAQTNELVAGYTRALERITEQKARCEAQLSKCHMQEVTCLMKMSSLTSEKGLAQ